MDRLFKYIRETSEKRTELELEYNAMKSLLDMKLQQNLFKTHNISQDNHEESTENLKLNLRELEKRRTQQALNYEEALLELEALKKNNKRHNIDNYRKYDSKDDFNNPVASVVEEKPLYNVDIGKFDSRDNSVSGMADGSSTISEDDVKYMFERKDNIPAPVQIRIENHNSQPGSKVIRWKSPDITRKSEDYSITSYHIYVDGDFFKAIGINESLSVVLPDLDNKTHRVCIRSVCRRGQSKDPQCTMEINSINLAPSILRANKITGTSATVSWMPSNSSMHHAVWVNGQKYCECSPGSYKIVLHGLIADSLQKIRVHPVLNLNPDTTTNSAYLDFQTLPVCSEGNSSFAKKSIECTPEDIESPSNVKLKLGSRPGKFIVYWDCPQQPAASTIRLVGYSILINNQCIALVNGAQNHKFSLSLVDLRRISVAVNQMFSTVNEQSCLTLTVRTLATVTETDDLTDCTIQSKDSQPPLQFSGVIAAEIAGTDTDAATMLGEQLAHFLNLKTPTLHGSASNGKSCYHSCYCLNNSDTNNEDSSFLPRSNFDWIENKSTPYRSISIHNLDQTHLEKSSVSPTSDININKVEEDPLIRRQLSNESCTSDSSDISHSSEQNSNCKSSCSPRGRTIAGQSNNEMDDPSNYLAVRSGSTTDIPLSKSISKDRIHEKVSVPKIQITKESSHSDEDETFYMNQDHNKIRQTQNQCSDSRQSRFSPKIHSDYSSRSIEAIELRTPVKQVKNSSHTPVEFLPKNQKYIDYDAETIKNPSPDKYRRRSRPINELVRYFVTLYDYEPATMSPNRNAINEELSFKVGKTIKIIGQVDEDGFYTGEINGHRGLIPSNMVEEINRPCVKDTFLPFDCIDERNFHRSPKSTKDVSNVKPMQDKPNQDRYRSDSRHRKRDESPVDQEQRELYHRRSADSAMTYATSSDSHFRQRSKTRDPTTRQFSDDCTSATTSRRKMIAMYDYDPHVLSPNVDSDAELPFKANDIITILSDIDEDGFYLGERDGRRGLVPSNFLTPINSKTNRLNIQQSFDSITTTNQVHDRKVSASSNLSDPPLSKNNTIRLKALESDRDIEKARQLQFEVYPRKRSLEVEQLKDDASFEESFDSGPSTNSSCLQNTEPKRTSYHTNTDLRTSISIVENTTPRDLLISRRANEGNQSIQRHSNPSNDRRDSHPKSNVPSYSSSKMQHRRQSPSMQLEPEDMPIVMDLAPTKENQKKKKLSTTPDNYRVNIAESHDNYGNSDSLYSNPNSSMSDNLDRKRSVFKNPFKKKKP